VQAQAQPVLLGGFEDPLHLRRSERAILAVGVTVAVAVGVGVVVVVGVGVGGMNSPLSNIKLSSPTTGSANLTTIVF
jgi:hypothetical protein